MNRRYGRGDRGTKKTTSKNSIKNKKKNLSSMSMPDIKYESHSVFGKIPLIKKIIRTPDGKQREYYDYDPGYQPELPEGAVRGDIRMQEFCHQCHCPQYFYLDQEKQCVQCDKKFIFSAKEQKYWYESLKFHFDSVAIRCICCRRRQRNLKAYQTQMNEALKRLKIEPEEPRWLLSYAEAIARYHQISGEGNLNQAIASCRQIRKRWPGNAESFFWEAICHLEAGRKLKAKELLNEFIKRAGAKGREKKLRQEANQILETME